MNRQEALKIVSDARKAGGVSDLRGADLRGAYLRGAYLMDANLRGAYLRDANLRGADLRDADLRDAKNIPEYVSAATSITPEGDIIGYKKFRDGLLGKLLIPAAAKRSNATGRKCRAEYAQVLAIYDADGEQYDHSVSQHNQNFAYTVGETVRPDAWDDDRWKECSGGIHFFLTEYEARNY